MAQLLVEHDNLAAKLSLNQTNDETVRRIAAQINAVVRSIQEKNDMCSAMEEQMATPRAQLMHKLPEVLRPFPC